MTSLNYKQIIVVVLGSMCLGLSYNYISDKKLPVFGFDIKKYVSAELLKDDSKNSSVNEPKHISLKEALKLYQANVTFIDAREEEDYQNGHIKNAINIPYAKLENYKQKLIGISKDEPLVSYCGGSDCDLSIMLGNKLTSLGYDKVFIFFGGWNTWENANYPVSK
ncbi:MAG: rhodanese-like domain-containing protein [Bacteroidota bacterium]|nr:rhodanese-like domain-containing protein [Bacteroidota bacterium]MDP4193165.1 rhodanese-like domain-containing protein [Bacteroidota bacterium]MDP4195580.1 rhodanese-like domain-containing protein [Bacteroidota bacterium]